MIEMPVAKWMVPAEKHMVCIGVVQKKMHQILEEKFSKENFI